MRQIKSDKSHIILTADKGVALVVMDENGYIKNAKILLEDPNTYQPIPTGQANKLEANPINTLRKIKTETKMIKPPGTRCILHVPVYQNFMDCQNFIWRTSPIVSSRGSVKYGVAKELARIFKTLVGKSRHHFNNTREFVEQINNNSWMRGIALFHLM